MGKRLTKRSEKSYNQLTNRSASTCNLQMTRKYEGAGLGLPLSRRLAELHQAHLEIKSEVGQGTTVHVTFPEKRVITDFEP